MSLRTHSGHLVCALALAAMACGGGTADREPGQPGNTTQGREPGQLGDTTLSGRVTFAGTAPAPRPIRMDSDPLCKSDGATSEILLVGPSGGVKNVFVYVKDGLGNVTYPAPTEPVMLDQIGCRYEPHVFGVQVNQPIHIMNSDPAVHNVNAAAKENTGFNLIQQPHLSSTRTFDEAEVMIPIRCDVHNWMNAWVGVVDHPFYAVTRADGSFEIPRLPAGTYTIEAWHERLGRSSQQVTVDGKGAATVAFTFKE
jgi:hypothetical protein